MFAITIFISIGAFATNKMYEEQNGKDLTNCQFNEPKVSKTFQTIKKDKIINCNNIQLANNKNIYKTKANYQFSGEYLNYTSNLSKDNKYDLYLFSTSKNKLFLYEVISTDSNLYAQLCVVDENTGTVTGTNVIAPAGQIFRVDNLPVGDYAILIFSKEDVKSETSYRAMANFKADYQDSINILKLSSILQYVQYNVGEKYYIDNHYVANLGKNSELSFTYNDGYYVNHYMDVGSPAYIKKISSPITYSSKIGTSSHAVALYMDVGTSYTYKHSVLNLDSNGNVSGTTFDFIDFQRFLMTPRYFDSTDVNENGDQLLILDYETGKVIDFYGSQNYFYATGEYPMPTITWLQ